MSPLLAADGSQAAELGLVRRHADWLREWFARHAGWTLQVQSELARLRKTPGDMTDGSRAADDGKHGARFSRRRYVLLCLALAALERSDRQTTLGKLADDIMLLGRAEPAFAAAGMDLSFESQDLRRDLVHAIRFLLERRVLLRIHGDELEYVSGKGDVLYTIRRPALAAMLNVRRGPSTIAEATFDERLGALSEELTAGTEEERNRRLRHRLVRRLIDDPVLYYQDLDADELAYLTSQRGHMLRHIEEATGLVAEVRKEGIALVDEGGELTDVAMPEEGTEGHLTLLLAEHLADRARQEPGVAVGLAALRGRVAQLVAAHRSHWRKNVTEAGADQALCTHAIERLESLRLLRRTPDGVVPLPAIGRYAVLPPAEGASRAGTTQTELFAVEEP
jgi:uncharacterized protein (TIGR02678 family)